MASNAQEILGLNTRFELLKYKGLTEVDFRSDISFLDYDAIIIDTSSLARRYETKPYDESFRGKRKISEDESFLMRDEFDRTKVQMIEFLKQGKNVFVLMDRNENCYVHSDRTEYSGTRRNARATDILEEFDVFSFLPINIESTMVVGETFDIVCRAPYSLFFQETADLSYYAAYFTAPKKSTLLTIPNSDKAISAVFEYEKGKIILLPHPCSYKTEEASKKYGKKYLDALFELNHALMACEDSYSLPLWTEGIKILDEEDQEKKLGQDLEKLINIKAEIAKRETLINKIRRKKILLAASGTTLEEVVKETLQEIGFALHEAEAGRSDIIASYDGVDVVAEIKGVSKSAAEKHAAQLEKWVAQFIEEKDHHPKALLIVNGYCDTPLSARTDEVFPDQMLKYCKSGKKYNQNRTFYECILRGRHT